MLAYLSFLLYALLLYNNRKTIANCEKAITNFSLLEVNCSSGYQSGSNLLRVQCKAILCRNHYDLM